MKPIYFDQANSTLSGGPAKKYNTPEDVVDLQVYRVGGPNAQVISCWKPNWLDRLRVLLGSPIWLHVAGFNSHAPVAIDARNPFKPTVDWRLSRLAKWVLSLGA